jgi:DNA-binding CsgD family transcriptional regulator
VTGATVREIAAEMHLSPRTVESHLAHAYDKLGVRSKQELRGRHGRPGSIERSDSGLET